MTSEKARYWFPAKRYGWGWGVPSCWQGWVVLIGYLVLSFAGLLLLRPPTQVLPYALYQAALTSAFITICWKKGEPPRWRWGDKP